MPLLSLAITISQYRGNVGKYAFIFGHLGHLVHAKLDSIEILTLLSASARYRVLVEPTRSFPQSGLFAKRWLEYQNKAVQPCIPYWHCRSNSGETSKNTWMSLTLHPLRCPLLPSTHRQTWSADLPSFPVHASAAIPSASSQFRSASCCHCLLDYVSHFSPLCLAYQQGALGTRKEATRAPPLRETGLANSLGKLG